MANERYQILSFEQQLSPEYWKWEKEKLDWFDDWKTNRTNILNEIGNRIKELDENAIIGSIIHDKDVSESNPNELVQPHNHTVVKFKGKKTITQLADIVGIQTQYIEKPKSTRYNFENLLAYLVHAKDADKYTYPPEEVETFETFDYLSYYHSKIKAWTAFKAKRKHQKSDESLDLILQKVQRGEITFHDLMTDEELAFLYANNQLRFNDAFNFYGERTTWLRLEDLKQGRYQMIVLYIQGEPGVGKTNLATELAIRIKEYGQDHGFESDIFSSSSKNPFDDYLGQDIIILDDLRTDGLSPSDWLKVFDPLNTARMSARYKNRFVVPRIIIVANYQSPLQFFGVIKGEDINQFIRRINYNLKIDAKEFSRFEFDNIYTLSEVEKLDNPRQRRINSFNEVRVNFDFKELFKELNDRDYFIKYCLENFIYPRIFPQNKKEPKK